MIGHKSLGWSSREQGTKPIIGARMECARKRLNNSLLGSNLGAGKGLRQSRTVALKFGKSDASLPLDHAQLSQNQWLKNMALAKSRPNNLPSSIQHCRPSSLNRRGDSTSGSGL